MADTEEPKPEEQPAAEPEKDREHVIIPFEPPKQADEQQPAAEEQQAASEPEAGELTDEEVKGIVESLLFAAGEPLAPGKLAELCGTGDARTMRKVIEDLRAEYDSQRRSFTVEEIAGGFQLLTRPEFHTWVGKLRRTQEEETLSQAALETLAIIAYRQPITRAQIEDIRGVQSGYILRSLIERSLVRIAGRSEELGRPLLYGTTKEFLDAFGLPSLTALPKMEATG